MLSRLVRDANPRPAAPSSSPLTQCVPSAAAAVPPRPMPASVAYNSDNESKYDENGDDSSLSEKPSEVSSTDSQVSHREAVSSRLGVGSFNRWREMSGVVTML